MGFGLESGLGLGPIQIFVGKPNSTMPPEFWAERAAERIIAIADTAAMPIREQARAFQDQVFRVIVGAINSAIAERKARDAFLAEKKDPELAQLIREDK